MIEYEISSIAQLQLILNVDDTKIAILLHTYLLLYSLFTNNMPYQVAENCILPSKNI